MSKTTIAFPKISGHQPTSSDFNQFLNAVQDNRTQTTPGTPVGIHTQDVDIADIGANTLTPLSDETALITTGNKILTRKSTGTDLLLKVPDVDYAGYAHGTNQTYIFSLTDCGTVYENMLILEKAMQAKLGCTITIYGYFQNFTNTLKSSGFEKFGFGFLAANTGDTTNTPFDTNIFTNFVTSPAARCNLGIFIDSSNVVKFFYIDSNNALQRIATPITAATDPANGVWFSMTIAIPRQTEYFTACDFSFTLNGVNLITAPYTLSESQAINWDGRIFPIIVANATSSCIKSLFCKVTIP